MLHLDQNLPHDILFHRIVEYIVIRLKSPFICNVFQNNGLAVFRTDRIKIQIGDIRHFLINLCQQILVYFRKSSTPDKFEHIPAGTDLITMQFDNRIHRAVNRRNRNPAFSGEA